MADERLVPMRLQRFLARSGVASRRGSENLMTAGRVQVNGVVVTELGSKVDPNTDIVTVDGRVVKPASKPTYLMLHKPEGYLTTMKDPYGRKCVAELVPTHTYPGLFPVGRLDTDTTGLLLFTTNGSLAQELLHPSHHVSKHYVALVEGTPTDDELALFGAGIQLDDGPAQPAKAEVLCRTNSLAKALLRGAEQPDGTSFVGIELHEGRKHQVKRMFSAIGHEVLRLHRDEFGPLALKKCARGSWRLLDSREAQALEALCAKKR